MAVHVGKIAGILSSKDANDGKTQQAIVDIENLIYPAQGRQPNAEVRLFLGQLQGAIRNVLRSAPAAAVPGGPNVPAIPGGVRPPNEKDRIVSEKKSIWLGGGLLQVLVTFHLLLMLSTFADRPNKLEGADFGTFYMCHWLYNLEMQNVSLLQNLSFEAVVSCMKDKKEGTVERLLNVVTGVLNTLDE